MADGVLALGAAFRTKRLQAVRAEAAARPFRRRTSARAIFAGAQQSRLTQDWLVSPLTIDQEVRIDLRLLRYRSRSLVRDNAYARRFVYACAANIVGPQGIRMRPVSTTLAGDPHDRVNTKLTAAWDAWCQRANASVDGKMSFLGLQHLLIKTLPSEGEYLVRIVRGADNPFGFALQVLDPDFLDHTYSEPKAPGRNRIHMGIEVDDYGKPIAYHLLKKHPAEGGGPQDRERIPAADILHDYIHERAGQTRGYPWFAAVLRDMKMLDGYQEAAVVAARAGAAQGGFFEMSEDAEVNVQQPATITRDLSPASFDWLPPGVTFTPYTPQQPTAAYDPFTISILHAQAAGLLLSYASLTGDLRQVNYSSIRTGMLAERDLWQVFQAWFVEGFCQRVFAAWLPMAVLSGQLALQPAEQRAVTVRWKPRGWPWVDPLKDVQATILAIQHGLESRTSALDDEGEDFDEIAEQLAREDQVAKALGITLVAAPPAAPRPMGTASASDTEEADGEASGGGSATQDKALALVRAHR